MLNVNAVSEFDAIFHAYVCFAVLVVAVVFGFVVFVFVAFVFVTRIIVMFDVVFVVVVTYLKVARPCGTKFYHPFAA